MLNAYADIQSLANYAKKAMGENRSNYFMNHRHKMLNHQTPFSFYMDQPSIHNYKIVLGLIESWCRENN